MDDSHPADGKVVPGGSLKPDTRRLILDVLKEIDPPHRDVLWMHDAEGRPVAAIAALLSIPASTVHARLRQARRQFRFVVARMRRQSIPFARELPHSLTALRQVDGDGPDVPFGPSDDLLRQMALSLRVLNPIRLAASLERDDNPPESGVHNLPRPPAHPRRPGRRA